MWLTPEQEDLIDKIGTKNQLTQEELAAIKNYQKFKQLKSLNPAHTGLGPGGIFPLEDILKNIQEFNWAYTSPSYLGRKGYRKGAGKRKGVKEKILKW